VHVERRRVVARRKISGVAKNESQLFVAHSAAAAQRKTSSSAWRVYGFLFATVRVAGCVGRGIASSGVTASGRQRSAAVAHRAQSQRRRMLGMPSRKIEKRETHAISK